MKPLFYVFYMSSVLIHFLSFRTFSSSSALKPTFNFENVTDSKDNSCGLLWHEGVQLNEIFETYHLTTTVLIDIYSSSILACSVGYRKRQESSKVFFCSKQRDENSKYCMVLGNKVEVNFTWQEILIIDKFYPRMFREHWYRKKCWT